MELTVKKLKELLEFEPESNVIDFGGLDFFRLDDKGDTTYFEFNQTITTDDDGNVLVENH